VNVVVAALRVVRSADIETAPDVLTDSGQLEGNGGCVIGRSDDDAASNGKERSQRDG
jgi:hypothetical protein